MRKSVPLYQAGLSVLKLTLSAWTHLERYLDSKRLLTYRMLICQQFPIGVSGGQLQIHQHLDPTDIFTLGHRTKNWAGRCK